METGNKAGKEKRPLTAGTSGKKQRLFMDDTEIRTSYNTAKDKKAQVRILAELNGTTVDVMERKLFDLGLVKEAPVLREKHIKANFDENRARELFAEGLSDLDIAEMLGVNVTAFASWRRANGLNRPMGGARKKRVEPTPCAAQPPTPIEEEMPETEDGGMSANRPVELPAIQTDAGELGRLLVQLSERYPGIKVTMGLEQITGMTLNEHIDLVSNRQVSTLDMEVGGGDRKHG